MQLIDTLTFDSAYYSNQAIPLTTEYQPRRSSLPACGIKPAPKPFTSVCDTVAPEVRVYLDDAFGQSLLEADSSVYDSNQDWREYLPWIAHCTRTQWTRSRSAVGIDVTTGLSRMRLHYHSDTDSAATYDFIINATEPAQQPLRTPVVPAVSKRWTKPTSPPWTVRCKPGVFSGAGLKTRIQLPWA